MLRSTVLVFSITALLGPAIRYLTWPPSWFERSTSVRAERFVSDLVFYLWPAQSLAALAPSDGRLVAFLLAVGGNILLFAFIGLVAGSLLGRLGSVTLVYGGLCSLLLLFALWGAGYRVEHIGVMPLLLAMMLYGLPFWFIVARAPTAVD